MKDAAEIAEILLPEDDIERFKALRDKAVDELKEVAPAVREAIRYQLSGEEMRWQDASEAGLESSAETAVSEGYLTDTGGGLVPNDAHGRVRRATQAVDALNNALEGDSFESEFFDWFEREYDGPPNLWQGAIWRSVFGRGI